MTRFTFCPEVVRKTYLDDAVAIAVLKQSATLDAVDIATAVDFITRGEAHHPFCCQVQPLSEFIFAACSDGQVHGCSTVLTPVKGGSET